MGDSNNHMFLLIVMNLIKLSGRFKPTTKERERNIYK